jgi:Protein of unknown function (DUF1759)
LNQIVKLKYLNKVVQASATKCIQEINYHETGYQIAIRILKEEYDRPESTLLAIISKFLDKTDIIKHNQNDIKDTKFLLKNTFLANEKIGHKEMTSEYGW